MSERVIAIGDIHGCAQALETLLEAIGLKKSDTLVPLGDIVDRGPDSRRAIEVLLAAQNACQVRPIMGNHEEMMLDVVVAQAAPQLWIQFGGVGTLDSYGFQGDLSVIPESHIAFLQSFQDYLETDSHFFVHANYDPDVPLNEQDTRTLRWMSLNEWLPGPHVSGKMAIVGHTAERTGEVFSLRHLRCIDTYCYGGGWLTALDVKSGQVWQANEERVMR